MALISDKAFGDILFVSPTSDEKQRKARHIQ